MRDSKPSIEFALDRVWHTCKKYGTFTDKMKVATRPNVGFEISISAYHIEIFKGVVQKGAVNHKWAKPPLGWKVYSFLLYVLEKELEAFRTDGYEEIEGILTEYWAEQFRQSNGNIKLAKDFVAKAFSSADKNVKQWLNKSYLKAKQQWERSA